MLTQPDGFMLKCNLLKSSKDLLSRKQIMKSIIPSIKGTRDFYPEDMAIRSWLYAAVGRVSRSFGYQEYEGPYLESLELYAAKSGDELVKEQSFVFPDRGGDLITLRPELTLTLARMVAQRQNQLVYPVRWWSFGPFWRYERPQKGRTREFFQWNIDLFGVDSPEADAELAAVAAAFFREVGLSSRQVVILVNSRRLVDDQLASLDIGGELRPAVSRWIDRRDKLQPAAWQANALEIGLSTSQTTRLIELLDDTELWRKSDELVRFFDAIQALDCQGYVRYDPNIVRGLDYYTGIVFEARQNEGKIRRAILGGGRYDNLLADVGGQPLPGVGFAMGDVVISLILEEAGLLPKDRVLVPAPVLVTVFDESSLLASFRFASELRQAGLDVIAYPESTKLAKQFKYADRIGSRVVVVLGPDEQAKQLVTIKDLRSGEQYTIQRTQAVDLIKKLLDA